MNKEIKTLIAIKRLQSKDDRIPSDWHYENFFWRNASLVVALNDDFLIFKDLLKDTEDAKYQYHLYSIKNNIIINGFAPDFPIEKIVMIWRNI